ncbi:MAG: hypothetical protein IT160_10795 [Bryobacterales bacterium]|nr:hypothetical protein [Bryobacterales bacterium]
MKLCAAGVALVLVAGSAVAGDFTDRAKLSGNWKVADSNDKSPEVWIIEEHANDAIHFSHSDNDRVLAEFECNTMGKECQVKVEGKQAAVSMWFNGAALVQMETRKSNVVKRTFSITGDGDSLNVEATPIVPPGKAQLTRFTRNKAGTAP